MARLNVLNLSALPWLKPRAKQTHEGAPAKNISAECLGLSSCDTSREARLGCLLTGTRPRGEELSEGFTTPTRKLRRMSSSGGAGLDGISI